MLKIGIDKTDRNYRHFEYDDERMYGDPQVFKVIYEETGDFGEVLVSNVISTKKSNSIINHFLDIPKYNEVKKDDVSETQTKSKIDPIDMLIEISAEKSLDEKKKSKSSKISKTKTVKTTQKEDNLIKLEPTVDKVVEQPVNLSLSTNPKTYEYDIVVIDNVSYIEDIKNRIDSVKDKLNELGKDGWEVCGFQTVQKVFGCQMIIIIKRGLI
jgi:hypothetical protein